MVLESSTHPITTEKRNWLIPKGTVCGSALGTWRPFWRVRVGHAVQHCIPGSRELCTLLVTPTVSEVKGAAIGLRRFRKGE